MPEAHLDAPMDSLKSYYDRTFSSSTSGEIYPPLQLLDRLAHERRMLLLSQLPLPDLSAATVVDYGVGSWGFGCIFPRLKECKTPVGIDISPAALAFSKQRSEADPALRGKVPEFHASDGYNLPLDDQSVDVFFAGECIEHIEDTDAFLEEVSRVLKLNGVAIFTTPNALPWIYRQFALRWCMGFEHVALMSASEFLAHLAKYFRIEVTKGFNQSLHPELDNALNEGAARRWVSACEDDIENATSMIALVRKTENRIRCRASIQVFESHQVRAFPRFADLELAAGFKGRMVQPDGVIEVAVPWEAKRCCLIFWSHSWSGFARISAGHYAEVIDLYSHVGGCRRVQLAPASDRITIQALDSRRQESHGAQVILFRAVFST
jgi:SAM-dependent methyltransferase